MDGERNSPLESDYYSQAFINSKFQAFDFELYQTKWFDYRHMTSFEATCAYIEVYGDIYRTVFSREMDHSRAEFLRTVTVESVRSGLIANKAQSKRMFTGFWRGRQVADVIGMPYSDYISLAFQFRMRRWQRAYLPRPTHLYHEFDVEKVLARWEELQTARLYTSEHPAYMPENYQNTAAQNDYHEWLFKQAGLRSNVAYIIARFVKENGLPMDKVRARFDDLDIERVEYHLQQD